MLGKSFQKLGAISGLLEDILGPDLFNANAQLDRYIADLQAKVGLFLQNKQALLRLEPVLSKLSRVTDTAVAQAVATLTARKSELLTEQDRLQSAATTRLSSMSTLKDRMGTIPALQRALSGQLSWELVTDTESLAEIAAAASDALTEGQRATELFKQLDAQNDAVAALTAATTSTYTAASAGTPLPPLDELLRTGAGGAAPGAALVLGGIAASLAVLWYFWRRK